MFGPSLASRSAQQEMNAKSAVYCVEVKFTDSGVCHLVAYRCDLATMKRRPSIYSLVATLFHLSGELKNEHALPYHTIEWVFVSTRACICKLSNGYSSSLVQRGRGDK